MSRLRRKRRAPSPNLTAMGDIAFLLIAFFVLVSTMKKPTKDYEMEPVLSPDVASLERIPTVTVAIEPSGDADYRVWVDKELVTMDSLEAELAERIGAPLTEAEAKENKRLRRELEGEELEAFETEQLARYEGRRVIFKCDRTTPHRVYYKIMEIVAELGAPVSLAAKPDDETKSRLERELPAVYKEQESE